MQDVAAGRRRVQRCGNGARLLEPGVPEADQGGRISR